MGLFSIFKNKATPQTDFSWLGADMHSHLIPGIDDGAQDLETSIALIKGLQDLGYKKLITTPHIFWELYANTPETINAGLTLVQQELIRQNIDIEIKAAAEYFIDDHFQQLLRTKTPLLTIKDNLVLTEFSMVTAPFDLKEVLFELQMQNYQPLIAHPERYIYLKNKKNFFYELKEQGCQFQLNLLSLTGHYGTSVQELAEYLIKHDFYSYAGTDLHSVKHLAGLQKLTTVPVFSRLRDSGILKNSLL